MGDTQENRKARSNWRKSLVPAPAVIPAPRAYINAVAVKGFVVELWGVKSHGAVEVPRDSLAAGLAPREHLTTGALPCIHA